MKHVWFKDIEELHTESLMSVYSHVTSKGEPIQTILDKLFQEKRNGVFVELGGYDGLFQSNTAFLEFERDWTGVLIEPSPEEFTRCKQNRPKSQCFQYACVDSSYPNQTVEGDFYGSPMASVDSTRLANRQKISVPAKTLSEIISMANITQPIDFLSLDVEGYELNVLKGLDFTIHRPNVLLIEIYTHSFDAIQTFLIEKGYKFITNLTNYNPIDNPHWDGTHNDYLFVNTIFTQSP